MLLLVTQKSLLCCFDLLSFLFNPAVKPLNRILNSGKLGFKILIYVCVLKWCLRFLRL